MSDTQIDLRGQIPRTQLPPKDKPGQPKKSPPPVTTDAKDPAAAKLKAEQPAEQPAEQATEQTTIKCCGA